MCARETPDAKLPSGTESVFLALALCHSDRRSPPEAGFARRVCPCVQHHLFVRWQPRFAVATKSTHVTGVRQARSAVSVEHPRFRCNGNVVYESGGEFSRLRKNRDSSSAPVGTLLELARDLLLRENPALLVLAGYASTLVPLLLATLPMDVSLLHM